MAEFKSPEDLETATRQAIEAGYKNLDAYSPFPIEALSDLVASVRSRVHVLPYLVLLGGIIGGLTGYALQYYIAVIDYPVNIGGRPFNSWPSFITVVFEMTILFAAFSAVLGMLSLNGLPMPYHPVFNVSRFTTAASSDRFFLCIEADDPKFDPQQTRAFLEGLNPEVISEVEGGPEE
jgi:hypothetical protein